MVLHQLHALFDLHEYLSATRARRGTTAVNGTIEQMEGLHRDRAK